MTHECPICKAILSERGGIIEKPGHQFYTCPRCGEFYLTTTLVATINHKLDNEEKRVVLSHAIFKMQRDSNPPILNDDLADNILKISRIPTPIEQANNFILWLGENSELGVRKTISPLYHRSVLGSKTEEGFGWILDHLLESGFIKGNVIRAMHTLVAGEMTLSFKGWEYYAQLKRGAINSRKAFMAMKFDVPELERIVNDYFKPAVSQTGFELLLLKDEPRAGLIDDRLRVEIRTSKFLIADLTHENAGAYWEAGFAEGLGKSVIYTCEKTKFEKDKTHFDTNHHLTVRWDAANPTKASDDLKATIRATLPSEAKLADD